MKCRSSTAPSWPSRRTKPQPSARIHANWPRIRRKHMNRRAKDPLLALNSELTSPKPTEPPADNDPLAAPDPKATESTDSVLDAEFEAATPVPPETEEYEQILEELRQSKTEQAVTERRNRKLTLDKATFGITGAIAVAFV